MTKRTLILLALLVASIISPLVVVNFTPIDIPRAMRELGRYYVVNTIRDTASPEAVAAVVWDYRGLDTVYETVVLYLAIVGGLAVFRLSKAPGMQVVIGLTVLSRTATKIIILLISSISAAIVLHGHLTPGGGFPGGSALAVTSMLIVPVFSVHSIIERGITSTRLIAIRGLALTALGLVALLPVFRGLELVTNQRFYPARVGFITVSGSISLYNLFEFFAVASGFTAVALYLSIPEEWYKERFSEHGG
ncbi:MAG: Na(+)/H(+) antiporter subunit B [Desulfurococcaceae archaeon]